MRLSDFNLDGGQANLTSIQEISDRRRHLKSDPRGLASALTLLIGGLFVILGKPMVPGRNNPAT